MSDLSVLFILASFIAALLAVISVWAPRRLPVKLTAFAGAGLFLPLLYGGFVDLLSKPKPVGLEWWLAHAEEASVLGSSIEEDRGIFLWLRMPDVTEPRAYVLPWDRELAEQLQKALAEAERNGSGVKMRLPFEPSLDDRAPKFYALPQPALPPKDHDAPPAEVYQHT
jgi:hypothetical protein